MIDEQTLQSIWYGGREPAWWLRALTMAYAAIVRVRQALYAAGILRRVRLPVPVVVVGNLTVGGTGKTPLVIALVDALRDRGLKPGVISRGYGSHGITLQIVDATSSPQTVGDEPCLIFRATHVPLAVCRDRVAAGRALIAAADVDVLIADDGLQHYRLQRDVEICVIDGLRRFGNGLLLPAGPLREGPARLGASVLRVCNGGEAKLGEVPMRLAGEMVVALSGSQQKPLRDFTGQRVHAVAGIGNPDRFFAHLRAAGLDLVEHRFADHFAYSVSDLEFGDELPVLMTAKDAVKCTSFARANWWSVPVRAELPDAFFAEVASRATGSRR